MISNAFENSNSHAFSSLHSQTHAKIEDEDLPECIKVLYPYLAIFSSSCFSAEKQAESEFCIIKAMILVNEVTAFSLSKKLFSNGIFIHDRAWNGWWSTYDIKVDQHVSTHDMKVEQHLSNSLIFWSWSVYLLILLTKLILSLFSKSRVITSRYSVEVWSSDSYFIILSL